MNDYFAEGATIRREVLGIELGPAPEGAEDFAAEFTEMAVGWCWGATWSRPQLDRRTRSIATLAMLTALGKLEEIKVHVKGALRNGVTPEEIREIIMHATIYAGVPAGGGAFHEALKVMSAEGVFSRAST